MITVAQFKQRVAQILNSYAVAKAGEKHSRLGKLVGGMLDRLTKREKNKYEPINKGAPQRPRARMALLCRFASARFASARGRMGFLDTEACPFVQIRFGPGPNGLP